MTTKPDDPKTLVLEAMVWLKMMSDKRFQIALEKLERAVELL